MEWGHLGLGRFKGLEGVFRRSASRGFGGVVEFGEVFDNLVDDGVFLPCNTKCYSLLNVIEVALDRIWHTDIELAEGCDHLPELKGLDLTEL